MNKYWKLIVILLVASLFATACGNASTPTPVPTLSPCAAAVQKAVQAMEANPAYSSEMFSKSCVSGIINDPNTDPAVKAGFLNGSAYMQNRSGQDAVDLAVACNIAPPKLGDKEQFYQLYGNLMYANLGPNEDIRAWSVMGGTPELDLNVPITEVENGGTLNVFGVNFTFTFDEFAPANEAYEIDLLDFDIEWDEFTPFTAEQVATYNDWLTDDLMKGYAEQRLAEGGDTQGHSMFMWSVDGRILFAQGGNYVIVKVINIPSQEVTKE